MAENISMSNGLDVHTYVVPVYTGGFATSLPDINPNTKLPYQFAKCTCQKRHHRGSRRDFQCGCGRRYVWGEERGNEQFQVV